MEMSEYVANLISVKDDKDIQSIKKACHLSIVTYVESIKLICESLSSEKCQDKVIMIQPLLFKSLLYFKLADTIL